MLAYLTCQDAAPGAADLLIAQAVAGLEARGVRLAGAVQHNIDRGADRDCDMELRILGDTGSAVRISQSLGTCSQGCRLDTQALAEAVARTEAALARGADLLVVNKFGKQESSGGGFRDTIARALTQGIPVLLHVPAEQMPAFREFAHDLAQPLTAEDLPDWCAALALRARA